MQQRSSRQPGAGPSGGGRQNEYFVSRDGIDREVISADICRYLGNDALVRPGVYESPETGQPTQGYFITAYRNLTTAMIEDLKADSARWDSERRQQTSRNASGVQYRYSETHQDRQNQGPTEAMYQHQQQGPYSRDGYDAPSSGYPGSGASGYGGTSGADSQFYEHAQQAPSSSTPSYGYQGSQPGYSHPQMNTGFQNMPEEQPYVAPVNQQRMESRFSNSGDPYSNQRMPSSAAAQSSVYATTGPSQQPGYPASAPFGSSYSQQPAPASTMPYDHFYGRASPGGATSQAPPAGFAQDVQSSRQGSTRPTTSTPHGAPISGASTSRHGTRETDRHSSDRHVRPSRR